MQESVLDKFLTTVRASRLIDEARLNDTIREFSRHSPNICHDAEQLAALQELLVSNKLLTRWQCKMLDAGKFKGFFLDYYMFMDFIGTSGASRSYTALDRRSGELVVLEVFMHDPDYDGIRYEVKRA
jgi:hypothetical protein